MKNLITLELIVTDGYSDKQIDFFNVPKKYIKTLDKYNAELTVAGKKWFKEYCNSEYDDGCYYRLNIVNKDSITIYNSDLNQLERIIKLLKESENEKYL